jgi:hypothetical protein
VEILVAPLVGEVSIGEAGTDVELVVKFHAVDHEPVPTEFFAFARQ